MTVVRLWMQRVALLIMAGFAAVAPAQAQTVLRFGFPGVGADARPFSAGDILNYVHAREILEKEFAGDKDISVTWTFFRGAGPALNESFAAGQLDFFLLGDLPAIVGRSRGLEHKFLLATGRHGPIYLAVQADSDIHGIDDLKGRKVAVFKGTNLQIATDRVLAAHHLAEKDLRFVNLDAGAAVSALTGGNVDAVFGGPEFLEVARKGVVRIIYSTKGDEPTLGRNSSFLVSSAFERAHPELVQRVVTAIVRAAAFASRPENRAEVFDAWTLSGFPKETFEADFAGDTLANRVNPLIDDYVVARYKDQAAAARVYGLLKTDVDIDGWFERKYLDTALRDLKLQAFWPAYGATGEIVRPGNLGVGTAQ
jgi:sulfonate transport system substrate-binding protein